MQKRYWVLRFMATLKILTGQDNPTLRAKAKRIPKVTKKTLELAVNMAETMIGADGVGLAAPQVGESVRLCIVPMNNKFTALINPEITSRSKETNMDEEGCLSLPGVYLQVERANNVTVRYTDTKGKKQERKLENFEARVTQHEIDHLDGILIVDKPQPKK